ncbi:MAG: hypothetical protein HFH13_00750 [Dorea sp.]|nr:hypothetical protein [Dorea sp.]
MITIDECGRGILMRECGNKIVWDLEICKNINLLKEAREIILYGAGEKGQEILGWLQDAGIKVDKFCDLDIKKSGEHIKNIEIISPFQMKNSPDRYDKFLYIIACIPYPKELLDLLECMGMKDVRVITYWGVKTAIQIHAKALYVNKPERLAILKIDNMLRKSQYINLGMNNVRSLITSPDNALWVIQPGKTATTSLSARLTENKVTFFSMHYLEYPNHILGEEFRDIWEKEIHKKKNLKVITAVREPLSRDYSAFWQAFTEKAQHIARMPILGNDFPKMYDIFIDFILKGSAYTKEKLGDSMPYTWNDEFEWFDEQIKKHLGIDVFQYPFHRERGYTIIKKENIELFLFKVEKMEDILDELSTFVGAGRLSRINANVAEQKWYGLAYAEFKKEVSLSKEYVNHYYCGNYKMDHFYTQEEKNGFLEKWRRNIENGEQ